MCGRLIFCFLCFRRFDKLYKQLRSCSPTPFRLCFAFEFSSPNTESFLLLSANAACTSIQVLMSGPRQGSNSLIVCNVAPNKTIRQNRSDVSNVLRDQVAGGLLCM